MRRLHSSYLDCQTLVHREKMRAGSPAPQRDASCKRTTEKPRCLGYCAATPRCGPQSRIGGSNGTSCTGFFIPVRLYPDLDTERLMFEVPPSCHLADVCQSVCKCSGLKRLC